MSILSNNGLLGVEDVFKFGATDVGFRSTYSRQAVIPQDSLVAYALVDDVPVVGGKAATRLAGGTEDEWCVEDVLATTAAAAGLVAAPRSCLSEFMVALFEGCILKWCCKLEVVKCGRR